MEIMKLEKLDGDVFKVTIRKDAIDMDVLNKFMTSDTKKKCDDSVSFRLTDIHENDIPGYAVLMFQANKMLITEQIISTAMLYNRDPNEIITQMLPSVDTLTIATFGLANVLKTIDVGYIEEEIETRKERFKEKSSKEISLEDIN